MLGKTGTASTTGATGTAVPAASAMRFNSFTRGMKHPCSRIRKVSFESAATFRHLSETSLLQNFGRGVVHGPSVLHRVLNGNAGRVAIEIARQLCLTNLRGHLYWKL